jgi:glycosyltransferase involved in cell wall biosynthesis
LFDLSGIIAYSKIEILMRTKIKAIFLLKYDPNWIGGVYYKLHLINALRRADGDIPIVVYTSREEKAKVEKLLKDINVEIKSYNPPVPRGLGRIELLFRKLFSFSLLGLFDRDLNSKNMLFDYEDIGILRVVPKKQRIYWIPDLQDLFMPELFPESVLEERKNRYKYISEFAQHILFSSYDSWNSFKKLYPMVTKRKVDIHILRFAVFHPSFDHDIDEKVLEKYSLQEIPYFVVSNQFMAHKNHAIVIDSLIKMKQLGKRMFFKVVFTGKTEDPRNPDYYAGLKNLIDSSNIVNDIMITGMIDREEQLSLMKNALAIIQPSFFEGWNSTVEDAKLMNLKIICSDIQVHREQLEGYQAYFFDPGTCEQLITIMETILNDGTTVIGNYPDYGEVQQTFSNNVKKLFVSNS